ncbi:hypothetical protein KL86APRO_30446 [uncultured Alphaproteobacteria bacterium]|uniref:Uncharacterized protein n=1 Tax=uncultured Alphaproteobacteria bacterium TaxID=91750 RepID=A0A212KMY6_9PROT|nr:hypothetical protein KL86APRO_30446 [uncultured Alphaproteobacteria bacterium]
MSGNEDDFAVCARYRRFVEALSPADPVRLFVRNGPSLHDARPDWAVFDRSTGELRLVVVAGDAQRGYCEVELRYSGAIVDRENVLRQALVSRTSEILQNEFAWAGGRLSHGFVLSPARARARRGTRLPEFRVAFDRFAYAVSPLPEKRLSVPPSQGV